MADSIDDPDLVAREYASLDRCTMRRLDRTGWLRDAGEPVDTMLAALAEVRPGRVLDAGSGDGGLAALVVGAQVVCLDQSAAAAESARRRGLEAVHGDIADLPFGDGEFDAATSVFGVMFAADPTRAARELVRVVRPHGTIALASWTPTGFVGEMFRVMTAHVPSLVRVPAPFVWGTEPGLRSLLAPDLAYLQLRQRTFTFRARSPEHFVEMFGQSYGPTVRALDAAGPNRFLLEADLLDLVRQRNRVGDGSVSIPATYLEAIATRR